MFRFALLLSLVLACLLFSGSLTTSATAESVPSGWTNPWITNFSVLPAAGLPNSYTLSGNVTNWANLSQLTVSITGVAGSYTIPVNTDGSFSITVPVALGTSGAVTSQATAGGTNNSNPMSSLLN
jgi:hypothetical protein